MRGFGFALIVFAFGALANLKSTMDSAYNLSYIAIAITMFSSGIVLVRRGRLRAANHPTDHSSIQDASMHEGDVPLPVTPPVVAALKKAIARKNRPVLVCAAGVFVLGVALGLVFYFANSSSATWLIWLGAAFGGAIDVYILIIWAFVSARGRRDLREVTYLRTSGPIRVDTAVNLVGRTTCLLRVVGHTFAIDHVRIAPRLNGLDWASIDHSRHMHVILEVRNRSGEAVYRIPE